MNPTNCYYFWFRLFSERRSPSLSLITRMRVCVCLAGAMVAMVSSMRGNEARFFRIRADAPITITSVARDGTITWTSPQANVHFTVEATANDGTFQWGAVMSGTQTAPQHSVQVSFQGYGLSDISVRATYSITPLANLEMILLNRTNGQEVAHAITDARGDCYFRDVPFGDYDVCNIETALYEGSFWWGPSPGNSRHFDVHVARKVPLGMAPEGTMPAKMAFSWGGLTDCAYYVFDLYSRNTNRTPELMLEDEANDLVDTTYPTPKTLYTGQAYYWYVTGYDVWGYPVMYGSREFTAQYTGDGGGKARGSRLFGLVKYSTRPIPGLTLQLKDVNYKGIATATTDARGWYSFADLPAGGYYLSNLDPNYSATPVSLYHVQLPESAGRLHLQLAKRSPVNSPDHQVLTTRTPTFVWQGVPESKAYTFQLVRSSPYAVLEERGGLTATTYTTAVELPDGDSYFWDVTGRDAEGTVVLQAGSGFMVRGL